MAHGPLTWDLDFEPDCVRVVLAGDLDAAARERLAAAREALELVADRAVIDLTATELVNGDGLRVLMELADDLAQHGVSVGYRTSTSPPPIIDLTKPLPPD